MTDLSAFLPTLSLVISICIAVGGFFALRHGYNRTTSEVQEKVIAALKAQNETQEKQIAVCEKEITRLKSVVATIQYALKRRGLRIEIDGDSITLIDDQSKRERTVQIQMTDRLAEEEAEQK